MNAKVAKRLRREAEQQTAGLDIAVTEKVYRTKKKVRKLMASKGIKN